MLKTLKWIYDLGVRHERHRIAAYLSSAQAEQKYQRGVSIMFPEGEEK